MKYFMNSQLHIAHILQDPKIFLISKHSKWPQSLSSLYY